MSGQEPDSGVASQQPIGDELAFPGMKPGNAWGESITKKRATELEAILQEWDSESKHGDRKGPFDKKPGELTVKSLSGADVFWLAAHSGPGKYGQAQNLHLEGADLLGANLEGAVLIMAHLEGAHLLMARLKGAKLTKAHLEGANFRQAHLEGANFLGAHAESARFVSAHLEDSAFQRAHLEGAKLSAAYLEGTDLENAHLEGADLRLAYLDNGTNLKDVLLGTETLGYVSVADARWGDVNLAVVDWTWTTKGVLDFRKRIAAIELGDESEARKTTDWIGQPKDKAKRLQDYKDAVRANRQLATALRNQGLNEDADRFAYKAQKLQRQVLRRQRRYGAAVGSWFLDTIAGYGYRPMRSLFTYTLVVLAFAVGYFLMRENVHPALNPVDAIIFSITSFHGRGFMPGENVNLHNPLTIAAAIEAIIGLLIEITFIATFTQRFFAR